MKAKQGLGSRRIGKSNGKVAGCWCGMGRIGKEHGNHYLGFSAYRVEKKMET